MLGFPFPKDLNPAEVPCRGSSGTLWLSEKVTERREAARLCTSCPIAGTCNTWMLQVNPTFGVFAGVDTALSLESPLVPI
jgi:hypothetical protein